MSLGDLFGQLSKYAGVDVQNPPESTHQDFNQVAQTADQSSLASGLTAAFHSNQTPAFPEMLGNLFGQSNGDQRAGILNKLLAAAGGAGAVGGLGSLLQGGQVTPQTAQQVSPENVKQIAAQAQQNNPSIVEEAGNFYSQHPQVVKALGAGALALIMSHISQR